jgi:hypothetical protein
MGIVFGKVQCLTAIIEILDESMDISKDLSMPAVF